MDSGGQSARGPENGSELAARTHSAFRQIPSFDKVLGKSEKDSEVQSAERQITHVDWAADILAQQQPEGWWVSD